MPRTRRAPGRHQIRREPALSASNASMRAGCRLCPQGGRARHRRFELLAGRLQPRTEPRALSRRARPWRGAAPRRWCRARRRARPSPASAPPRGVFVPSLPPPSQAASMLSTVARSLSSARAALLCRRRRATRARPSQCIHGGFGTLRSSLMVATVASGPPAPQPATWPRPLCLRPPSPNPPWRRLHASARR